VGALAVSLSRAGLCTSGKKRKALSTSHWITTASLSLRTNASTTRRALGCSCRQKTASIRRAKEKTCTDNYTGV
jgi:hypothetical protein